MEQLNVITCIGNPIRWKSRIKLYNEFEQHMLDSGVKLTTVECAYGERPWEIPDSPHVNVIRVRCSGHNMGWNKESLLNIGLARTEGKYVGNFDADIRFRQKGWAEEAVHALQHFHAIQPWTVCYDLGPDDEHIAAHKSFASLVQAGKPIVQGPNAKPGGYEFGHPGYAWCWTRQALDWVGGFVETAVLGAADHHMAMALVNRVGDSIHGGMTKGYKDALYLWQARAVRHLRGEIGALPGTIEHAWHGNKAKRAYVSRWDILARHQFDPVTDLKRNTYGVSELAGNKLALSRDIHRYFASRDEDANTMG